MKNTITLIMVAIATSFVINVYADNNASVSAHNGPKELAVATFAGGCFWCVESDFEKLPGIAKVVSGFSGGHVVNSSYEAVSRGATGHVESVQVFYDPDKISYPNLLDAFWRMVNPTDNEGQFVDRGEQYRTLIFYHTEEQKQQV